MKDGTKQRPPLGGPPYDRTVRHSCAECRGLFMPRRRGGQPQEFCTTRCRNLNHGRRPAARRAERKYKSDLKRRVLEMYGGPDPGCACCGENDQEFLSIDHVAGGGNRHKVYLKKVGVGFYGWLIKTYRNGFRVLCMNCNFATRYGRVCPHQRRENASAA